MDLGLEPPAFRHGVIQEAVLNRVIAALDGGEA